MFLGGKIISREFFHDECIFLSSFTVAFFDESFYLFPFVIARQMFFILIKYNNYFTHVIVEFSASICGENFRKYCCFNLCVCVCGCVFFRFFTLLISIFVGTLSCENTRRRERKKSNTTFFNQENAGDAKKKKKEKEENRTGRTQQ